MVWTGAAPWAILTSLLANCEAPSRRALRLSQGRAGEHIQRPFHEQARSFVTVELGPIARNCLIHVLKIDAYELHDQDPSGSICKGPFLADLSQN